MKMSDKIGQVAERLHNQRIKEITLRFIRTIEEEFGPDALAQVAELVGDRVRGVTEDALCEGWDG